MLRIQRASVCTHYTYIYFFLSSLTHREEMIKIILSLYSFILIFFFLEIRIRYILQNEYNNMYTSTS